MEGRKDGRKWREGKEVKWSEVKWCDVMWREAKVGKWSDVKGSEGKKVKWSEVIILGETCILTLIYSCVDVCKSCAVRCVTIIFFSFYFLITQSCFFNILFMFVFWFYMFASILCILCFYIVWCIISPCLLSLSYFCTSLPTTATGWKPNCSK